MKIPFLIQQKYSYIIRIVESLKKNVNPTLITYCEQNNFAYSQRIKTIDSLTEKIETSRYESFYEIDDIWAVSIIIPTLKHEESVIEYIKNTYDVTVIKKRGETKKAPEVFRFDSTRIICKCLIETGQNPIYKDMLFEVQVKSAFEHAWTVATHAFNYKSDIVDWRISRLAYQMKSTVEQLDMIALGHNDIYENITGSQWTLYDAKELIYSYVKVEKNKIPDDMLPSNLSRFCDNLINILSESHIKGTLIDKTNKVLNILTDYIEINGYENMPKSVSLFQYFLCILIESDYFNNSNLKKIPILISDEMEMFYPKVKKIENRFQIDF
jgi:ppGpp synthetase/RelA/SpoT-type nucleotidyltranferase